MMSHVEAYHLRMKKNDATFKEIAKELQDEGCKVYRIGDGDIGSITIVRDNKHIALEFREIPYRWTTYYSIVPSKQNGSSITLDSIHGTENPWTSNDLMGMMVPNPKKFSTVFMKEV